MGGDVKVEEERITSSRWWRQARGRGAGAGGRGRKVKDVEVEVYGREVGGEVR